MQKEPLSIQRLSGIKCAAWVWAALWDRDDPTRCSFDILDAMTFEGSEIAGWIFTASDGEIKSKLKSKWTMNEFFHRCRYDESVCAGAEIEFHAYHQDQWLVLTERDHLRKAFALNCDVLLPLGFLGCPRILFLEHVVDFQDGNLVVPKLCNHRLCSSKSKGRIIDIFYAFVMVTDLRICSGEPRIRQYRGISF